MSWTKVNRSVKLFFFVLILVFFSGHVHALQNDAGPAQNYYTIGKGDILEISVWKEPEISRRVQVRVDGRISMPLVDDIHVAGMTPIELKEVITRRLSDYIEVPVVTIVVHEQAVQSYYVLGEVQEQGEFILTDDITVLQALAMAGGFTEWANKRNLLLLRNTETGEQRIDINYRDIVSGNAPDQNLRIMPGDTLVVP